MKTKILLIFVLFTISVFGQFKANKDGFSIKMESKEDKNVICNFVLYYNKGEYFDMHITIGVNLDETNKPTKLVIAGFKQGKFSQLTIPYEDNLNIGVSASYSEKDKQHKIICYEDEIMEEILYLLVDKYNSLQIYTRNTFYNFDIAKYNDKMTKNKKFNDAIMRLIYNPK